MQIESQVLPSDAFATVVATVGRDEWKLTVGPEVTGLLRDPELPSLAPFGSPDQVELNRKVPAWRELLNVMPTLAAVDNRNGAGKLDPTLWAQLAGELGVWETPE